MNLARYPATERFLADFCVFFNNVYIYVLFSLATGRPFKAEELFALQSDFGSPGPLIALRYGLRFEIVVFDGNTTCHFYS